MKIVNVTDLSMSMDTFFLNEQINQNAFDYFLIINHSYLMRQILNYDMDKAFFIDFFLFFFFAGGGGGGGGGGGIFKFFFHFGGGQKE